MTALIDLSHWTPNKVRELRTKHGLSQQALLADEIGMSRGHIVEIEAGRRGIGVTTAGAMAMVFATRSGAFARMQGFINEARA